MTILIQVSNFRILLSKLIHLLEVVEVHVPLTDKLDDMLRGVNKLQASGTS
jgi:hypothetical protein